MRCPECGSENVEENDPRPGEHTCRDCGAWIDDDEMAGSATPIGVCDDSSLPEWGAHLLTEGAATPTTGDDDE